MIPRENLYLINNYEDFCCMKGQCPHTCCKNWIIAIDEDTEKAIKKRIHKANLKDKILLKLSMHREKNGIVSIRKIMGTCPYYTREGLCGHEKCGNMELMPLICRMYPRRVVQIGDSRVEVTMELSCFSAALWFLKNDDVPKMVPAIDYDDKSTKTSIGIDDTDNKQGDTFDLEILWRKNNDAPSYLSFLDEIRKRAIDELTSTVGIEDLISTMENQYKRIGLIQNELMRNTIDGEVDPQLLNLFSKDKDNTDSTEGIIKLPIPITILNRVIYECFDASSQKKRNPVFYHLLTGYYRLFGNDSPDTAEQKLLQLHKKILAEDEVMRIDVSVYKRYMSYCLMEEIPEAYEDYYLVGKYLFSIFYTEIWILFDVVSRIDESTRQLLIKGTYSPADDASEDSIPENGLNNEKGYYLEADILSAFERAFRHSPAIKRNILAIIREDFLSQTKE